MPAITVDDITVLPRIPEPDPTVARQRPVRSVTSAPRGLEGEGFPVRRAFAGVDLAELDPFVHLDQMGEVEYAPGEDCRIPISRQAESCPYCGRSDRKPTPEGPERGRAWWVATILLALSIFAGVLYAGAVISAVLLGER